MRNKVLRQKAILLQEPQVSHSLLNINNGIGTKAGENE